MVSFMPHTQYHWGKEPAVPNEWDANKLWDVLKFGLTLHIFLKYVPCSYSLLNTPEIHALPTHITVWTNNSIFPERITNCTSDKDDLYKTYRTADRAKQAVSLCDAMTIMDRCVFESSIIKVCLVHLCYLSHVRIHASCYKLSGYVPSIRLAKPAWAKCTMLHT